MTDTWIVAGLGNPGPQYDGTRHNAGRTVVGMLASQARVPLRAHKAQALVAETRAPSGARCVLAQPNSFMNLSGGPVQKLQRFYSTDPAHLIVVHDDLDLPLGTLRLKAGGGHGGHNGVRDIIAGLGTPDFLRVRIGIGRPRPGQAVVDFVLQRFSPAERSTLDPALVDAAEAVEMIVADGLAAAQQRFHTAAHEATK